MATTLPAPTAPPGIRLVIYRARRACETWTNLSALSNAEKRATWARIRTERPGLATLLQGMRADPDVQAVIAHFDADVLIESFGPPSDR